MLLCPFGVLPCCQSSALLHRIFCRKPQNLALYREVNCDLGGLCSLFLLIGAANLDTLLLSVSWTLRRRHLTRRSSLLIALITSIMTALSLEAGRLTAGALPASWARWASAALMSAIGIREALRSLTDSDGDAPDQPPPGRDTLTLALLLALNNIGVGIAAGLAGYSPLTAGTVNLCICLAMLGVGAVLGRRGRSAVLSGQRADLLSGAVMAVLGVVTALS